MNYPSYISSSILCPWIILFTCPFISSVLFFFLMSIYLFPFHKNSLNIKVLTFGLFCMLQILFLNLLFCCCLLTLFRESLPKKNFHFNTAKFDYFFSTSGISVFIKMISLINRLLMQSPTFSQKGKSIWNLLLNVLYIYNKGAQFNFLSDWWPVV